MLPLLLGVTWTGATFSGTSVNPPQPTDYYLLAKTHDTVNTSVNYIGVGIGQVAHTTTEANHQTVAPGTFTFKSMVVYTNNSLIAGRTLDVKLRINGADATGFSCTVPDSGSTCSADPADIEVVKGDELSVSLQSVTASVFQDVNVWFLVDSEASNERMVMAQEVNLGTSGTDYLQLQAFNRSSTLNRVKSYYISAATAKQLYVEVDTAPGAGTTRTFSLNQNGSSVGLNCVIANTATSCTGTGSISVAEDDFITIQSTATTGSPASSVVRAGLVLDHANDDFVIVQAALDSNTTNTYYRPPGEGAGSGETACNQQTNQAHPALTVTAIGSAVSSDPSPGTYTTTASEDCTPDTTLESAVNSTTPVLDDTGTITVEAGNDFGIQKVPSASPVSGSHHYYSFRYEVP